MTLPRNFVWLERVAVFCSQVGVATPLVVSNQISTQTAGLIVLVITVVQIAAGILTHLKNHPKLQQLGVDILKDEQTMTDEALHALREAGKG